MNKYEWQLIDPEKAHWQIETTKDLSAFLRAVPIIAPPSCVMYFESGSPDEEIESFFMANSIDGDVIPMGSCDPNPFYHLPISTGKLEELAQIAEKHCEVEIAAHIHIYCSKGLILQWYDAFWDPSLYPKKSRKSRSRCSVISFPYTMRWWGTTNANGPDSLRSQIIRNCVEGTKVRKRKGFAPIRVASEDALLTTPVMRRSCGSAILCPST